MRPVLEHHLVPQHLDALLGGAGHLAPLVPLVDVLHGPEGAVVGAVGDRDLGGGGGDAPLGQKHPPLLAVQGDAPHRGRQHAALLDPPDRVHGQLAAGGVDRPAVRLLAGEDGHLPLGVDGEVGGAGRVDPVRLEGQVPPGVQVAGPGLTPRALRVGVDPVAQAQVAPRRHLDPVETGQGQAPFGVDPLTGDRKPPLPAPRRQRLRAFRAAVHQPDPGGLNADVAAAPPDLGGVQGQAAPHLQLGAPLEDERLGVFEGERVEAALLVALHVGGGDRQPGALGVVLVHRQGAPHPLTVPPAGHDLPVQLEFAGVAQLELAGVARSLDRDGGTVLAADQPLRGLCAREVHPGPCPEDHAPLGRLQAHRARRQRDLPRRPSGHQGSVGLEVAGGLDRAAQLEVAPGRLEGHAAARGLQLPRHPHPGTGQIDLAAGSALQGRARGHLDLGFQVGEHRAVGIKQRAVVDLGTCCGAQRGGPQVLGGTGHLRRRLEGSARQAGAGRQVQPGPGRLEGDPLGEGDVVHRAQGDPGEA